MNYANLIQDITENIKTNGSQAITAQVLQDVLVDMVGRLGQSGALFGGVIDTSFEPDSTNDAQVVYIAEGPGTYTNFNGLVVGAGEVAFFYFDSNAWAKSSVDVLEVVNNLNSTATDKALSAAMGKQIGDNISQLAQEVHGFKYEGSFVISATGEHSSNNDRITFGTAIPAGEYTFKVDTGTTGNSGPVLFYARYVGASANTNVGRADIGEEVVVTLNSAIESLGIYMSTSTNQHTGTMPLTIKSTEANIEKDILQLQSVINNTDNTPTYNSDNLVKSKGIFSELQKRLELKEVDVTSTENVRDNDYIIYSDGTKTTAASAGGYKLRYYNCENINHIGCYLGQDNTGYTCAIAFYSSQLNFSGSTIGDYMKPESVPAKQGINWYDVNVPAQAKYVCIINRGATYANPVVLFYSNEQVSAGASAYALADKSYKISQRGYGSNPFRNKPYYYHYSANDFIKVGEYGEGVNAIASESLDDIGIAARLGFEYIEANIHKTSDDNFVVIHGSSGNFGPEVKSVDESVITTETLQATAINSKSLAWIKENVIYDSYYLKYQNTIPSLEEFCVCCKENNIGVFAGTNQSAAIEILRKYLGENIILYNPGSPNIRNVHTGWVFIWNNNASSTIDELVTTADSYGAPFMLGIGVNVIAAMRTAGTLSDLINQMHAKGYLIGFVEEDVSESTARALFKAGMDFAAAGHSVNPFVANYEIYDIDDENHLPATTGTLNDGKIDLAQNETISCGSTDTISLGKGCLTIRFNGTIRVDFGSYGVHYRGNLSSDGSDLLVISDYFFRKNTHLIVTALASTTITEFVYKTSRC